jgi:hypothetical protein
VWGAGGGGGGTDRPPSASNAHKGGGGGGGGYRNINNIGVSPDETLIIVVGSGGLAGNFQNGGDGGFSRVSRGGTALITVNGGNGGIRNGAGGNGGAGDTPGGNGGNGNTTGGGASGAGGNGGNGGIGGLGVPTATNGNGTPGQRPAGGGGGSRTTGNDGNKPGGLGGDGQVRISYIPPVPYKAEFSSLNLGEATWCSGVTRPVTVTVTNTGTQPWTSGTSPNINFSWWWSNQDQDSNPRLSPFTNLAPGASQVLSFTVTAPATTGTFTLNYDLVKEGDCWFRNNTSSCGTGNVSNNVTGISVLTIYGLSYTTNGPLSYCAGQAITANNASLSSGVPTSFSVSPALPAGLVLNTITGQITGNPTTAAGVTAANYTVTATNSCGNTTRMLNIAISPAAPTGLNYTSNPIAYCSSQPITANSASTSGGGAATSFSVSPALPAGLTLNTTTGQLTGTPSTIAGIAAANYTVTASNSCGNTTRVLNITIAATADVTDISTVACSETGFSVNPLDGTNGTIPTVTTYSWTPPMVMGGVTGGIAGTGTSITGTLVNPTNIARSAIYTVIPITNGCDGDPFTITVLLNPTAAITSINASTCSDNSFTVTPTNGTNGIVPASTNYTWTTPTLSAGLTGGLAGSGNSISGALTNSTNTPQTATYTVTPITGSCVGDPFTVTVTVNPKPALTLISAATCSNQPFSITPANGTNGLVPSGTTYTWTSPSAPAGINGGAAGSGANITGGTLTNTTNTAQTATYTVTPTSGTCVGNAFTVTINVNPIPVIPTQTPTICSGATFTVNPVNGSGTIVPSGTTYTWIVVDNPNVTGESAQASTQSNISQTLTNTSLIPQTVTYTATPTSGAAGNCVGNPFTVIVTVNPSPILTSPLTASRCSNVSTSYTATSAAQLVLPSLGPEMR